MAFSPLKITPFQLKITFSQRKIAVANFHSLEQTYLFSGIVNLRSHTVRITTWKNYVFSRVGSVCPWRPNVIYWRQKMYWNPISIFPFRPNYVILEMYLPLLPTKILVQLLKGMWFMILWLGLTKSIFVLLDSSSIEIQIKSTLTDYKVKGAWQLHSLY